MKNLTAPLSLEMKPPSLLEARLAFRKRVEAQVLGLPQRFFGIKKNSFKIRLSNRVILLLLGTGLHLKSSTQEIQATLEKLLRSPLSRIVSCGQLTFGDVLVIRTSKQNNEIEIERINRRSRKSAVE